MRIYLAVAICLVLSIYGFGQTTKQTFKSIKYATYRMDGGVPEIDFYSEVDENGLLKVSRKYSGQTFTTSTLRSDQIKVLNSIFNGSQKLQASVAKTKFEEGTHYAGNYHFVIYTDLKGVSDTLSFIPPFMSESFQTNFERAQEIFYRSNGQQSKSELKTDSGFLKSLNENHKRTTYLPKFEAPPPGM